jgi:hypothetical protein
VCIGLKVEGKNTVFEDSGFVERDGLLLGEWLSTFRRIVAPSYVFSLWRALCFHFIYSAFQIPAEVDIELVIIRTISIIQNESYNKTQIIVSL